MSDQIQYWSDMTTHEGHMEGVCTGTFINVQYDRTLIIVSYHVSIIKGVYREEGMQLTLFSESPNLVLIYF